MKGHFVSLLFNECIFLSCYLSLYFINVLLKSTLKLTKCTLRVDPSVIKFPLSWPLVSLLFNVQIIHHQHEADCLSVSRKTLLSTWSTLYYKNSKYKRDAMKGVPPVKAETLKIKCPLHSWFTLLYEWWLQKYWKKFYA